MKTQKFNDNPNPPSSGSIERTAIILAGGLGTRLRGVISDLPKSMAQVNGLPFLHYLFVYLTQQKISKAVLAVGYKSIAIESYFGDKYLDVDIVYSKEQEPLGTGGAIKKALEYVNSSVFVLNGDTFFDVNLNALAKDFSDNTDILLAMKPMENFERYGSVLLNLKNRIEKFEEKKFVDKGLINGGVYLLRRNFFEGMNTPEKFSFEKDILEKYVGEKYFCGKIFDNYFIDIGIPEDYARAQQDFIEKF